MRILGGKPKKNDNEDEKKTVAHRAYSWDAIRNTRDWTNFYFCHCQLGRDHDAPRGNN